MAVLKFLGRMIVSLIVGLGVVSAAIVIISVMIQADQATLEAVFFFVVFIAALTIGYCIVYGDAP